LASKTSSRVAARKLKDRWRAKNWYRVMAPDMFEAVQIGETLADSPDKITGRIIDVTLQQLTGDFSKMHIKLHFRIDNISGSDAFSNFIGHSLTSDYIRRLTRRKRSKMDGIYDVLTKDGFIVRVKPFAVTEKRIQTSQQHAIRMKMKNIVEEQARNKLVSEFIREMLAGDLSAKIFRECKPIYPIKRVEIRRSEIIGIPAKGPEMILPTSEVTEPEESAEPEVKPEVKPVVAPAPTVAKVPVAVAVAVATKVKAPGTPDAKAALEKPAKTPTVKKAAEPKAKKETAKKTAAKKTTKKKKEEEEKSVE